MTKSVILTILLIPILVNGQVSSEVKVSNPTNVPSPEYQYFYHLFSKGISSQIWDNLDSIVANGNFSSNCRSSLGFISEGIKTGDLTSFRFLDSSAKVPTGLLDGTISAFGDYDQCLRIVSEKLTGKYCTIKLRSSSILTSDSSEVGQSLSKSAFLFNTFPMSLGICFPSTCSNDDVHTIATEYLASKYLSVGGSKSVKEAIVCDTSESVSFDVQKLTIAQIISL